MSTIRIPTPLRNYTDGTAIVSLTGNTIREALGDLIQQYPALKQHLCQDGRLRSFVNIYLNQEDIRYLEGIDTIVNENDQLILVPSIAGGR